MMSYQSMLVVLLIIAAGFSIDLLMAHKYYRLIEGMRGRELFLAWLRQRGWLLAAAGAGYLLFVGASICLNLLQPNFLPPARLGFVTALLNRAAVMTPNRIALILLLFILMGCAMDLFIAMRSYSGPDNLHGWRAFLSWLRQRFWYLTGASLLYLGFAWLCVFTDLVQLPGLRYENNRYVVSAANYLKQKNYRAAVLELRNALQKNRDDQETRLVLAKTLMILKDFTAAEREYRTVIAADAASFDSRFGLGYLLLATGRREPALVELRLATRLKPAAVEPHLLLAGVYRADGDYPQAVRECSQVLAVNQGEERARSLLVATALAGGLYNVALLEAEIGVKLAPEDMTHRIAQALALRGLGRVREAEGVLRGAALAHPDAAEPWFILASLFTGRRDFGAAINSYEDGLKRDSKNVSAMNNLAQLLADYGHDNRRAHELAAYVNWKEPGNGAYADTLGWILVKEGKPSQALPLLRRAVTVLPGRAETHYHLGVALLKSGNPAVGRGELTRALGLSGTFDGAVKARTLLKGKG